MEENCIKVIGFMIVYRIHTTVDFPKSALFTLGKSITLLLVWLSGFEPGSCYDCFQVARVLLISVKLLLDLHPTRLVVSLYHRDVCNTVFSLLHRQKDLQQ